MTTRKNNKLLLSCAILFYFFTCTSVLNAQSTDKTIDDLVERLQNKVLLTDKQANDIKSSLTDYFNNTTEENRASLQTVVESSLNEKQKMKYDIIKDDWWKNVQQEVKKVK
jgi:hypothetical protein